MVLQSECHGTGHQPDRRQVLTKTVMQILTESALFPVTDFKDLSLKFLSPSDLVFQFFVGRAQCSRSLLNANFQECFAFLQLGLGVSARGDGKSDQCPRWGLAIRITNW